MEFSSSSITTTVITFWGKLTQGGAIAVIMTKLFFQLRVDQIILVSPTSGFTWCQSRWSGRSGPEVDPSKSHLVTSSPPSCRTAGVGAAGAPRWQAWLACSCGRSCRTCKTIRRIGMVLHSTNCLSLTTCFQATNFRQLSRVWGRWGEGGELE